ncbi:hypothetical protein B566_EDAN009633 [Ephemera danica]|nr:hypothetical protein B566_EDAN009633 [Ephemera danica]
MLRLASIRNCYDRPASIEESWGSLHLTFALIVGMGCAASRKVSKCGYLFVAPGWDFSDPINRTKRWQRRWFVLYDDGELTYSVDEHVSII